VVNQKNWIHFIDLTKATPVVWSDNIGIEISSSYSQNHIPTPLSGQFQWEGLRGADPNTARDSVALTDTRAVVLTNFWSYTVVAGSPPQNVPIGLCFAYVYDLTTPWPPQRIVRHSLYSFGPGSTTGGSPVPKGQFADSRAHDIAISPDEIYAVATTARSAGFIHLQTGNLLRYDDRDNASRSYWYNVDTVELTPSRAVLTHNVNLTPSTMNPRWDWVIEVYSIDPDLNVSVPATFTPNTPSTTIGKHIDPFDLALTPNGTKAIVKVTDRIVVIEDLANPGSSAKTEIAISGGSDPSYSTPATPVAGIQSVHVSDAVIANNQIAVCTGTIPGGPTFSNQRASIELISIGAPSALAATAVVAQTDVEVNPVDLVMLRSNGGFAIRCAMSSYGPPAIQHGGFGSELTLFNSAGQLQISGGLIGSPQAVDSLERATMYYVSGADASPQTAAMTGRAQIVQQ
jgi:hypothetical protein